MATEIDNVNVTGEDLGEMSIDYDAPEAGSFPPAVVPGDYAGVFKLDASEPFGFMEIDNRKYMQVTHGVVITGQDGDERELNFFRASFYRSEKMAAARMNSSAAELTRALGIKIEGKITPENWQGALRAADGRTQFTASYGWELYCKNCRETTVSTSPNKKKGQQPWPKDRDGKFIPAVACPACHATPTFGTVRIVRYKLPSNGQMASVQSSTQPSFAGIKTDDSIPL